MPAEINYKKKYLELRSKYINDLDMAFRLGAEQGQQQAQQQQALDAEAQAREDQMQMAQIEAGAQNGDQPGQPGQPGESSSPEQPGQPSAGGEMPNAQPSELDQHIGKLESMISSPSSSDNSEEIKKALSDIITLRKAEKMAVEMRKSEMAIQGIAKALHKPSFKIGVQASHNLTNNAKQAVTLQHKIVNDVMKSWADEEKKATNQIESILNIEGLLKE